jgi:hypothetical protein
MKNGNTFEGTFVDGKRHGHGVFHAPSGVSYDGMFKHGLKSGRGRVQNVNGSYYIGNFKNNRIEGSGLLQLKGEDEVENWHTQRFTRRNWPAGLRMPTIVRYIKNEIKEEFESHQAHIRDLTQPLDDMALAQYVAEVRELNEQEERDRLMEAEREKRKALEERREKVKKAREDARAARGEAIGEELAQGGDD